MATRRTPEEIEAIVDHCVELEQSGGDILAYLWSENYLTPRATWFNFQREWLGRKPYEYTDGKPKKERRNMSKPVNTSEDRQRRLNELIERIKRGMGIRAALADMGYTGKSAWQQYRQIRNYAEANDPNAFRLLPEKVSDEDTPIVKISGPIVIETPEKNKVEVVETPEKTLADAMAGMRNAADTLFGDCEKMGLKMDAPKTAVTKPLKYDGFEVRAVSGTYGTYHYSNVRSAYIDYETHDGDELSMTVEQWRGFLDELHRAAQVLGVEL